MFEARFLVVLIKNIYESSIIEEKKQENLVFVRVLN